MTCWRWTLRDRKNSKRYAACNCRFEHERCYRVELDTPGPHGRYCVCANCKNRIGTGGRDDVREALRAAGAPETMLEVQTSLVLNEWRRQMAAPDFDLAQLIRRFAKQKSGPGGEPGPSG